MIFFFAELLQIAIGNRNSLSHSPSEQEWNDIFTLAKKQALLGVTYVAVEKLSDEQKPPRGLLLRWFVAAEHIRQTNEEQNQKAVAIAQRFHQDGFRNVILKGQGVAQYYKRDNLELYRTPGDVDIWLDGTRESVVAYVRRHMPDCKIVYHHVDFPKVDGVEVEVHFTPSWMNDYFTNRRLQLFFNECKESVFTTKSADTVAEIPAPDLHFNRVYILVHIYRHLFHEGVGLRQLMDYYYILCQGFTEEERKETIGLLQTLKMRRFVSAVMWVLQEVFGMDDRFLLLSPSEREGRFLLEEIVKSGNFGQYDKRIIRNRHDSDLSHSLRKIKRNFSFVWNYPSEVLWSPIFKLWHYLWRKRANSKC